MKIKVLVENTAVSKKFGKQHGLSYYIETNNKKILHDLCGSKLFIKNAEKMSVDISAVDFAVISHGHSDHGGGLKYFIEANSQAKIYMHKKAFEPHYAKLPLNLKFNVGLDKSLEDYKNIIYTDAIYEIDEQIKLFSDIPLNHEIPSMNKKILKKVNGRCMADTFDHECYMLVKENDKYFLFVGCAHRGINNIVDYAEKICGQELDYVVGGFHLSVPYLGKSEPDEYIESIAHHMDGKKTVFLTGHCTGMYPYRILRKHMGDNVQYASTGSVFEL